MTTQTSNLRVMVRGAYDLQKLRISVGNRIAMNFRAKLGQEPSKKLEDAEAQLIVKDLKARFKRLTDGLVRLPQPGKFKGDNVISSWTELALVAQYVELERQETAHFRRLQNVLEEIPFYTGWLRGVRGVGPAMAGVLLGEIDIAKAKYPSSLWKYAGLDLGPDGAGRSKRKEHLIDRTYKDREGKMQTCKSITYNPFLKTKLVGVLAGSFLRCDSPYAEVYRNYRHRLENHPKWTDAKKINIHRAALRYMIKMFLIDFHVAWRSAEGLPVSKSYHEAKLGHKHAA